MPTFTDTALREIQGFGVAGFNKDHQEVLFVRFGSQTSGRRLLAWLQPLTASAWEVGTFNALFKDIKARTGTEPLSTTWVGVLISAAGYQALGVATTGLPSEPGVAAFTAGMAARATTIGDTSAEDAPTSWLTPFRPGTGVHACVVVAADERDDLYDLVTKVGNQVAATGCQVVYQEEGGTLPGALTGHEHFGFKDGISQPSIAGYTPTPSGPEPAAVQAGELSWGTQTRLAPPLPRPGHSGRTARSSSSAGCTKTWRASGRRQLPAFQDPHPR